MFTDSDLPPSGAALSGCGRYRYALWRTVPPSLLLPDLGAILFVLLNPSRADALTNDPTIWKLLRYTERWGYTRLYVGNLYAFRSPHPKSLLAVTDPVGPENDDFLRDLVGYCSRVVVAWGDGLKGLDIDARAAEVLPILGDPYCLQQTRAGRPKHSRFVPETIEPHPYRKEAA